MRILFFIFFILTFCANFAYANDTDSASLTLQGEVPSLVRVQFANFADGDTLDLGDLTESKSEDVTIEYLANVGFSISVSSDNGGALVTDSHSELDDTLPYELQLPDDSTSGLSSETEIYVGERGSGEVTVTILTDAITFDSSTNVEDVFSEGVYTDTLTFTITAE